jgi:two-component system sensor histidine kinase/response regulator
MNMFMTFVERFKLNTKLILGFSSGLIIAAAISLYSMSSLKSLESEMEQIYEIDLLGISHIKEANINLIYIGRSLRHMMIAQDDITRDQARARLNRAVETLRKEMENGRKRIVRAEAIARYEQFNMNFTKYMENVDHALQLVEREKANPSVAAKFITSAEFMATVNAADEDLTALTKIKEKGSKATIDAARQRAETTQLVALLLLVVGVGLAAGFGVLIGATINRPNDRLRTSVEKLADGDVESPIPHADYPNEIGVMARAIKVLQDIYRKANEQHWVKSHSAEISSALQQTEDFLALTQTAISRIAPVIGAGHAAFYVADKEDRYNLLASYGYRERKHLNNSFGVGEGLVGQCVMEKSTILLSAPQNYIRINSGLGEGPPACIMVMPIIHSERVLGVLEMASFQQFTDRERAVLEAMMPVLATSMEIMDRNLRTKELLVATQEQAERMEKQAAQLEEQSVEMEAQQAELLETESWFRSIIESAPDGMLVVDADGRILLSNPKAEKIFGYEFGELVGTAIGQLVPTASRGSHAEMRASFMEEGQSRLMGEGINVAGLRKDGTEFPLAISLSLLPARGSRGKCVSVSIRKT